MPKIHLIPGLKISAPKLKNFRAIQIMYDDTAIPHDEMIEAVLKQMSTMPLEDRAKIFDFLLSTILEN